jgi:hypothetical protein
MEWNAAENKNVLKINSRIDNDLFIQQLDNGRFSEYSNLNLSHFLDKLNLTESIKIN